ncbi:hypothetical protein F5B21DRAFT_495962 [Xylaria acuta]|nr:hypothetical protein F5B21DRAFT_495962 [Xylaria acuta]
MFGTLKAGNKNNAGTMVFVEQNKQSRILSGSPHSACKTCRERKLKCTGEATGCKRCKFSNAQCEYPRPTEDKRGSKSRRTQGPTVAVGREPPPVAPSAQGQSSRSNNQQSAEKTTRNSLDVNTLHLDVDLSVPSFPGSGLPGGLSDDLPGVDTAAFLENMEQSKGVNVEDPNFFQHALEEDMPVDLGLPPLDVAHYGMSSSDLDNGFSAGTWLGENSDSTFMGVFLAPQVHWYQRDGSSSQGSPWISNKDMSSSWPRVSRPSTAPSKPTSSYSQSWSPFVATLSEPQSRQSFPESSDGSDSDSSIGQCRCSDRALRLLEKLPNMNESSSPSSGGSGESSPPAMMDTMFPAEVKSRAAGNMTKAHFIQAAALFLSHFSHDLAVFSAISQCRGCLRKSSFSMINCRERHRVR